MVVYPVLRIEPTETGSRFALYWVVRGCARHPKGWMSAVGRASHTRTVPVLWQLVRDGLDSPNSAELEAALTGRPGITVSRYTTEIDTEEQR